MNSEPWLLGVHALKVPFLKGRWLCTTNRRAHGCTQRRNLELKAQFMGRTQTIEEELSTSHTQLCVQRLMAQGENNQSKICPKSNFNVGYHQEVSFLLYFPPGSSHQEFMSGTSSYSHPETLVVSLIKCDPFEMEMLFPSYEILSCAIARLLLTNPGSLL